MNTELTKIITDNQNLIYKMTHYFNYPNKDDLFQAGCMGIIKAYKNFNNNFKIKFTTYAYPYILGEMKKLIREDYSLKVGQDLSRLSLKIEKVYNLLSQRLMHEPSVKEIADFLELDEKTVVDAMKARQNVDSIDRAITDDDKLNLIDLVANTETMELNDLIFLKEQLNSLNTFEQNLIKKRYFEDLTQSEVANILGISQVQVSRKEQKVLTKLKDKLSN